MFNIGEICCKGRKCRLLKATVQSVVLFHFLRQCNSLPPKNWCNCQKHPTIGKRQIMNLIPMVTQLPWEFVNTFSIQQGPICCYTKTKYAPYLVSCVSHSANNDLTEINDYLKDRVPLYLTGKDSREWRSRLGQSGIGPRTVSYTHLDVYKRQV